VEQRLPEYAVIRDLDGKSDPITCWRAYRHKHKLERKAQESKQEQLMSNGLGEIAGLQRIGRLFQSLEFKFENLIAGVATSLGFKDPLVEAKCELMDDNVFFEHEGNSLES
jgi:hypothetical protein